MTPASPMALGLLEAPLIRVFNSLFSVCLLLVLMSSYSCSLTLQVSSLLSHGSHAICPPAATLVFSILFPNAFLAHSLTSVSPALVYPMLS
jgi:hypothetical protein